MTTIQVCRTCLAHDTRMYTIADTPLRKFYEKITNTTSFNTQDGRQYIVCYICHHLLKKYHTFTESAIRADEALQQIYKDGIQITEQNIAMIDKTHQITFISTPVVCDDISDLDEVTENIEAPKVKKENCEIKTNNKPATTAMDGLEFSEYCEVKIEKFEVEETQCDPHYNSDSDDIPLQSIKKENEEQIEIVPVNFGQERTGAAGPKMFELEPIKTSEKLKTLTEDSNKGTIHSDVIFGHKDSPNLNMAAGDHLYKCIYCDFKSSNKQEYLNHIDTTNSSLKKFSCDYCEKTFTCSSSLKSHVRIHSNEKQFSCKYCAQKFRHKSALNRHVLIHTGEKPYSCDYCERKFRLKDTLVEHLRTHTGEKPFACSFCGKLFSQRNCLRTHLTIHTDKKLFQCNYCDLRFKQKSSVTRHVDSKHSDEKPDKM